MSVAAAVAAGSASAGMGILAAARALGLDFIPVAEERYVSIVPEEFASEGKVASVLAMMEASREFHEEILALGGYDLRDCGRIMYRHARGPRRLPSAWRMKASLSESGIFQCWLK